MKRNLMMIALIFSALSMVFVSCSKKNDSSSETPSTPSSHWYSPEPGANGTLPVDILPASLVDTVGEYFTVYSGENPPIFDGQFVSRPHVLIFSNVENDTVGVYNDRYIAFFGNNEYLDFYGKQWDNDYEGYYEEAYRKLYVVGTGDEFTCYYLTEGYPNGLYAKQSTVFSGKWNEIYGGLKNFQVAVILLETSGNPNLAPEGSFRVLGDGDELARDTAWFGSNRAAVENAIVTDDDPFRMFRVK